MYNFKNPFRSSSRPLQSQVETHPSFTTFTTRFACMSFNSHNSIRLIKFAEEDVLTVRQKIGETWQPGHKHIRDFGGSREIQMHGKPWAPCYHGNDDARRLLLEILRTLYARGWIFSWAVDVTRGRHNKDSLIFRKQWPPPLACEWILMSFDSHDKIKIINSPQDLTNAILATLGDDVGERDMTPERFKVHIRGRPWRPSGLESVETRSLLLKLVQTLERCGFTIYAAIGNRKGGMADMLVCQRKVGWVHGDQILHR